MDLYEKIKELAFAKNISISRLEEELGFANASLKRWRSSNPGADKLTKVADYFHVSVDYLLGREDLTISKQPVDLADLVDDSKINWDEWVSFDGKPLTDEVKTAMKLILGKRLED